MLPSNVESAIATEPDTFASTYSAPPPAAVFPMNAALEIDWLRPAPPTVIAIAPPSSPVACWFCWNVPRSSTRLYDVPTWGAGRRVLFENDVPVTVIVAGEPSGLGAAACTAPPVLPKIAQPAIVTDPPLARSAEPGP